ncbi:MAG: DUF4389 domain-containing protein [Desulfobacteraceae bacterium]|nr:DUF4389 domain-containing protein [Desulfobacteraceae bacterium]
MDEQQETNTTPRSKIAMRFLFTLICMVLLHAVYLVIQVTTLIQYAILLLTRSASEPLRRFANRAISYSYRLMRYVTLNENTRPFPFAELPQEMESPEDPVRFD